MSPVRAEDLTPAARRALGIDGAKATRRSKRTGTGDAEPCAGTCSCGQKFPSYTKWEKHADAAGPGHHRWSIDETADAR